MSLVGQKKVKQLIEIHGHKPEWVSDLFSYNFIENYIYFVQGSEIQYWN